MPADFVRRAGSGHQFYCNCFILEFFGIRWSLFMDVKTDDTGLHPLFFASSSIHCQRLVKFLATSCFVAEKSLPTFDLP